MVPTGSDVAGLAVGAGRRFERRDLSESLRPRQNPDTHAARAIAIQPLSACGVDGRVAARCACHSVMLLSVEDVADLIGSTVGGIEPRAAVEQFDQLASELLQFVDAGIDVGQLVVEQSVDV